LAISNEQRATTRGGFSNPTRRAELHFSFSCVENRLYKKLYRTLFALLQKKWNLSSGEYEAPIDPNHGSLSYVF